MVQVIDYIVHMTTVLLRRDGRLLSYVVRNTAFRVLRCSIAANLTQMALVNTACSPIMAGGRRAIAAV